MHNSNIQTNPITGYVPEELAKILKLEKKYRSEQIFLAIAQGKISFDDISTISLRERNFLSTNFTVYNTKIEKKLIDIDGTIKLQISTFDNYGIETVLLTDKKKRKTACVSCQIGCPLQCSFCKTGQIGFVRNLKANEIVEQFFHLEKLAGTLDNIVFMGMGEPFLNFEAVKKAITILTHTKGRALSKRRITISTSGICEGITALAEYDSEIRLAVSLTTANSRLRTELMPVTKTNSLEKLKETLVSFSTVSKKRISLEVALMSQVNTSNFHAQELADFCKNLPVHINLIPWNPVSLLPFSTPSHKEITNFYSYLVNQGLNVTIRKKRGTKIAGSCGQLGGTIKH